MAPLTPTLLKWQKKIYKYARGYGLDPIPTIFEMVSADEMREICAYTGFAQRYPHWRFGMEYAQMRKTDTYGLGKVYELVINNDPCIAYLQRCNPLVDQKLVMAHVYGHSDFFKNNIWFSHTNRKMIHVMADHAGKIKRYMDKHGVDKVEEFIDSCLSLENLIDIHAAYKPAPAAPKYDDEPKPIEPGKFPIDRDHGYMDRYINPPDVLREERKRLEEEARRQNKQFPELPEKDILLFLRDHAPLENWQRHILEMVREEAYYFAPQMMTKVANEGYASFFHSKIMTEKALTADELVDFADRHSKVAFQGKRLNPYKLGLELWRDIEYRWNTGRFGKEWEECDDPKAKANWDRKLGLGMEKVFEVRRTANDVTFIDDYLTKEFCERNHLFVSKYDFSNRMHLISSRDFRDVKQALLFQLTNMGSPIIRVQDANFENRSELQLAHQHEGVTLDWGHARDTLVNLFKLWQRPVHIDTVRVEQDQSGNQNIRPYRLTCKANTGKDADVVMKPLTT